MPRSKKLILLFVETFVTGNTYKLTGTKMRKSERRMAIKTS